MSERMSVEERVRKALNFEEPDRVPMWEALESPVLYDYFAAGKDELYTQGSITYSLRKGVIACRELGIDVTYGCMVPPSGETRYVDEDGNEIVTAGQTTWNLTPSFSSVQDIIDYKPSKKSDKEIADEYLEYCYRLKDAYAPDVLYGGLGGGFGFIFGYDTASFRAFSLALYDALEHLERIWDHRVERAIIRNTAYVEHNLGPVVLVCEDIAYKGGLMISPSILRDHFFPRLQKAIEPLKRGGVKAIFHSDGDITEVLDDLIEAGSDGINPIDPSAGMDIGYVKEKYGDKLILVGNVDGSRILPFGTPEEVEEEVKSCIRKGSPGGGHLIECGNGEIMPDVPLENALTFFRAVHKYGRYPIRI